MTGRSVVTVVLVGLGAGILAGCASDPVEVRHEGLFVSYDTMDSLASASDAVVLGRVIDSTTESVVLPPPTYSGTDEETNPLVGVDQSATEQESQPIVFTYYEVEITDPAASGYTAGERIQVRVLGGTYKNVKHVWSGIAPLERGKSYAFFLHELSGQVAEPTNPQQSVYERTGDGRFTPPVGDAAVEVPGVQHKLDVTFDSAN